MKNEYCLGFALSMDNKSVALIKKKRPAWQMNKYNGIGGHLNIGETPLEAMVREFNEESGVLDFSFQHFATLDFSNALLYCFKINMNLDLLETMTDEEIDIFDLDCLPDNMVENTEWLINMAKTTHCLYEIKVMN